MRRRRGLLCEGFTQPQALPLCPQGEEPAVMETREGRLQAALPILFDWGG